MINVIVTMLIKEGRMEAFLAECAKIRPLVLAEKGCLGYDYTLDTPTFMSRQEPINANRVTLIERWASEEALRAHSNAPHMVNYVNTVQEMRESVVIRATKAAF